MFIFLPPIGLDMDKHKTEIVVYYSAFWILYNIGFAMSNTNYLAMIPELCDSEEARMSLTLIRNSMVNCTSILAYIAALIVFNSGKLRYDPLLIRCLRCKISYHKIFNITLYLIFHAISGRGFRRRERGAIQKFDDNIFCCRFH